MKKIFLLFALTLLVLQMQVQAQSKNLLDKDVPVIVKNEFSKTHPDAMEIGWKQINTDYYVEYTQNAFIRYSSYTPEGKLIDTRDKITTFELPQPAYAYVKEHHQSVPLKEYFRITDAAGNVTYGVKIKDQQVLFDKSGTYLKTVDFIL